MTVTTRSRSAWIPNWGACTASAPLLDLLPKVRQTGQIRGEVLLFAALADSPDDESAVIGLAQLVNDVAKALALSLVADALRDADVVHRRHVDQVATRQRDVRGCARALGADRLLRDLDQHLLPYSQDVRDVLRDQFLDRLLEQFFVPGFSRGLRLAPSSSSGPFSCVAMS